MRTLPTVLVAGGLGLLLAGCRSCEPVRPTRVRPPSAPVLDRTTVLAELSEEPAPAWAPALPGTPAPPAPMAHHPNDLTFAPKGGAVVWVAQGPDAKFHAWRNGEAGPPFDSVGDIVLSADGRHWAYGGITGEDAHLMVDGVERGRYADLGTLVYSPDGAHLAFEARFGAEFRMIVDGEARRSSPTNFNWQDFSADSKKLLLYELVREGETRVVVLDVASRGPPLLEIDRAQQFQQSDDKSRVAVVVPEEGGVRVLSFDADRPQTLGRGRVYERVAGLEFGDRGEPLAYYGLRAKQTYFVVEGEEVPLEDGELIVGGAAARPGRRGFGALVKKKGAVTFRQFLMEAAPAEPSYPEAFDVVYGDGGRLHAYRARRNTSWFVVVNGKEGPPFDSLRPPAVSPDGRFVVYRARRGDRRFVVVAGPDGRTLREHPAYDEVHDVRFTDDGRSVAYGVKDGNRLVWVVEPL